MKKVIISLAAALLSVSALADAINVTAYQRFPWNGLVDITYTIPESAEEGTRYYAVDFYVSIDGSEPIAISAVTGDGAQSEAVTTTGLKKAVWDAYQDFPELTGSKCKIGVVAEDVTEESVYFKLDIESGKMTVSRTAPSVAQGADSKCKELWFKNVKPGTFLMGSSTAEKFRSSSNENQHEVTITKPFMISVFELTQGQVYRMTGENPSYHKYDLKAEYMPMENANYNRLRGASAGTTWPNETDHRVDPDSIIGKIRAHFDGKYLIDLPTEAQWEYACRAVEKEDGSYEFRGDNVWNNGLPYAPVPANSTNPNTDTNLDVVAWHAANAYDEVTLLHYPREVGLKKPNGIGLYDMHGNVAEYCLDWQANYGTAAVTDPVGPASGTMRTRRGGWITTASNPTVKYFRIAYRVGSKPDESNQDLTRYQGCRLVLLP